MKKPSIDMLKIHNNINLYSLGEFNAVESDVFSATCLEMYNSNGGDIMLSISSLKKLSNYIGSNDRFIKILLRGSNSGENKSRDIQIS